MAGSEITKRGKKITNRGRDYKSVHNTILLFPAKKLDTIEFVINHELKLLVQYLQCNKISFNETITGLIIFRTPWKHLQRETDIKINNYRLKLHLGASVKYLGVPIGAVLS